MRIQKMRFVLLGVLTLSFFFPAGVGGAGLPAQTGPAALVSPAGWLNPDGSLRLDGSLKGTLDLSGYDVSIDPVRGPVFGPAQAG
jgi:hypothetical protein